MDIQSSYFSYLFVLGMGQSVLLTTALWKSKKARNLSKRFFLVVLVIMTIELLYGLLYQSRAIFDFPHLLRINTILVFAFGPALYLSLFSYFNPDKDANKTWRWHFIPALLVFIYFIPLFMASAGYKLNYLNQMFDGVHTDSFIFGGLRRIQQGAYTIGLIFLFKRHRNAWQQHKTEPYFKILMVMVVLFLFMWLGDLYRYFFHFDLYTGIINTVLMSGVLLYLTANLVLNGSFFDQRTTRKYASSSLSSKQEQHLFKEVEQLLEHEKAFLDPELTLRKLAGQLEVPANYLSQAINHQLNQGYSDFINEYRVAEARRLLENRQNHKLTLEYLARQSGFKSTSSFNSAFKKLTGQTPSQYRSRQV